MLWHVKHYLCHTRWKDKNKLYKEIRLTIPRQECIQSLCDTLAGTHSTMWHSEVATWENTGLRESGTSSTIVCSMTTTCTPFPLKDSMCLRFLRHEPQTSGPRFTQCIMHTPKVRNKYDMTYPDLPSCNSSCLHSLFISKERKKARSTYYLCVHQLHHLIRNIIQKVTAEWQLCFFHCLTISWNLVLFKLLNWGMNDTQKIYIFNVYNWMTLDIK